MRKRVLTSAGLCDVTVKAPSKMSLLDLRLVEKIMRQMLSELRRNAADAEHVSQKTR